MAILWVKAFHVIAMVTWFAGLFYLPRLFVYHAMTDSSDTQGIERFKIMERKLYYGITYPGAVLTIALGGWLMALYGVEWLRFSVWLHIKLVLVCGLIAYHLYCGHLLKAFKRDENRHSHVYYRWFNEVPVIFLISIILLAILKPVFS